MYTNYYNKLLNFNIPIPAGSPKPEDLQKSTSSSSGNAPSSAQPVAGQPVGQPAQNQAYFKPEDFVPKSNLNSGGAVANYQPQNKDELKDLNDFYANLADNQNPRAMAARADRLAAFGDIEQANALYERSREQANTIFKDGGTIDKNGRFVVVPGWLHFKNQQEIQAAYASSNAEIAKEKTMGPYNAGIELGKASLEHSLQRTNDARQAEVQRSMLNNAIADLPDSGVLQPGTFGAQASNIAKAINGISTMFGGNPVYSQAEIAAGEEALKDTGRLGQQLAKTTGSHAQNIIAQSTSLNPGINNTKQGYKVLSESIGQMNQNLFDYHNELSKWLDQHNYNSTGFDQWFYSQPQYSANHYAENAIYNSMPQFAIQTISDHINDSPEAQARLKKDIAMKYGQGAFDIVRNRLLLQRATSQQGGGNQ
jgi:hypothetical protein